jgi:hypothetical protein
MIFPLQFRVSDYVSHEVITVIKSAPNPGRQHEADLERVPFQRVSPYSHIWSCSILSLRDDDLQWAVR